MRRLHPFFFYHCLPIMCVIKSSRFLRSGVWPTCYSFCSFACTAHLSLLFCIPLSRLLYISHHLLSCFVLLNFVAFPLVFVWFYLFSFPLFRILQCIKQMKSSFHYYHYYFFSHPLVVMVIFFRCPSVTPKELLFISLETLFKSSSC